MSLEDMLSSTTIGSSLYQDMNREDAQGLLEIGRHRGIEAAPNAAAASEIEIEERLAAVTAKVDEMKLIRGEEIRRLAAENERLRRRNDELEARAQAAADGRRTEPEVDEVTDVDDVPSLRSKLRDANAKIQSLRSQLAEVQRRSDETRDILEERLESALQDSYDQKIDHLSQTAALRRDLADLYREQEADAWACAASHFALDMERDHRKDTVSLMRSRMEKELTEKVELIESLKEAVEKRDRNIEALTLDLEEAREQLKKAGWMPRRGSQLEGTMPRETGLFSQLHQALGVPESSSSKPPPPSQPTPAVGNTVGASGAPQRGAKGVVAPLIKQDISPRSMPFPNEPQRNSTTPQVA